MTSSCNPLHSIPRTLVRTSTLLLLSAGIAQTALADPLPLVTGAEFDGSIITWQPLATATGYNIYLDSHYVDTVVGTTEYFPDSSGEYRIAGFDGIGNFSPLEVTNDELEEPTNFALVDVVDDFVDFPSNIRGTVYSRTAGEIFWDRDNTRRLEYIVSLNGVELGTTTGNSYWIDSLLIEAQNLVSIKARTLTGSTSETMTLAFNTVGRLFPVSATIYDLFVDRLIPAPENVRLELYSSTAAELFWDRPQATDDIVSTEIYRNFDLIGFTDGNSYFDDTRSPDTLYTYELVAVGGNGDISDPTFIDPGPFENTDETIVATMLAGISQVTTANPHVQWFPLLQSMSFGVFPDEVVEVSTRNISNDGVLRILSEYDCDDGSLSIEKTIGYRSVANMTFEECRIDLVLFEGGVNIISEGGLYESVDYRQFAIGDTTFTTLDGNVTNTRTRGTEARYIDYNTFDYNIIGNLDDVAGLDTLVTLDQTVAFEASNLAGPSTFDTSFSVSAPWTNGRILNIYSTDTFATNGTIEGNYTTGTLTAELDNGDSLMLTADTGNFDTWYVEISDNDGTRGFNGVWGDLVTLPCILLNEECR